MSRRAALVLSVSILVACGGDDSAVPAPDWSKEALGVEAAMGERRGLTPARSIVHLHSPYSHDACDGEPRGETELGPIDEDCLTDLRNGLCAARIDVAALTDHDGSLADEEWGAHLFLYRDGDELLMDNGTPIANWIDCQNGHRTMVRVGSENALMPVFLENHPTGDADERHSTYDGTDTDAADALRAAGGTLWVAHTESKEADWLREMQITGMEIYNIHASIDPGIRTEFLDLDGGKAAQEALEFNVPGQDDSLPEPDLLGLPLMFENEPSQTMWNTLLGEGRRIAITAGTDAHQNAFPIDLVDGERGDSYRRMIRLASNILLVDDPESPTAVEEALASGRSFVAFELLGSPNGFDIHAVDQSGNTKELGAELRVSDSPRILVQTPSVAGLYVGATEPVIETIVFRIDETGRAEVARGGGLLDVDASMPGAYFAVVTMTPKHLLPYLGPLPQYADRSYTWLHTNAIYVRP